MFDRFQFNPSYGGNSQIDLELAASVCDHGTQICKRQYQIYEAAIRTLDWKVPGIRPVSAAAISISRNVDNDTGRFVSAELSLSDRYGSVPCLHAYLQARLPLSPLELKDV